MSLFYSVPVDTGEAPLLEQGSLCILLERVGVLADFQLVYSQLAASCSAMAAAVAAFHCPNQVCDTSHLHGLSERQSQTMRAGYQLMRNTLVAIRRYLPAMLIDQLIIHHLSKPCD